MAAREALHQTGRPRPASALAEEWTPAMQHAYLGRHHPDRAFCGRKLPIRKKPEKAKRQLTSLARLSISPQSTANPRLGLGFWGPHTSPRQAPGSTHRTAQLCCGARGRLPGLVCRSDAAAECLGAWVLGCLGARPVADVWREACLPADNCCGHPPSRHPSPFPVPVV
jgi:hypothetical protein